MGLAFLLWMLLWLLMQFRLWLCRDFQELQCILHFGFGDVIVEFSHYESVADQ